MTLKASNTNETLKPREVVAVPEKEYADYSDFPTPEHEDLTNVQQENLNKLLRGDFEGLPDDTACMASYEPENDMSGTERRLQRLEGQMDGLLDRLAKYNVRAQHRI